MDCGRSALNTYHSSHVRHRTRSGGKRHNCPQCWTGSPHARHPAIYSAHVKCRQSCCGLARVGGCRGDVGMGMGRRDHTPFHPPSRDKNPYPPVTPPCVPFERPPVVSSRSCDLAPPNRLGGDSSLFGSTLSLGGRGFCGFVREKARRVSSLA